LTATPLLIGTVVPHTGVSIGRGGTNVLIGGSFINLVSVPYINGSLTNPAAPQPRLVLAKYIMPVNTTTNTGTVVLNSIAGGMGGLNTSANEQLVGTTWRYKFNGFAVNAASGNQLTLQFVHAYGTQNLVTWTYGVSTPANANFNGEIVMFYSTLGATVSPQVSGHLNFVDSTSVTLQNITVSTFSPNLYNTTAANSNNIQIVASPSTGFQYVVSNFTVEWLR
jgi:hypothetical protein